MRVTFAFLLVLLFAGCGDLIEHHQIDASIDMPSGSGARMGELEPSPQDGKLELVVIGASLIVVLGPAGAVARRRRALKDEITDAPPFS